LSSAHKLTALNDRLGLADHSQICGLSDYWRFLITNRLSRLAGRRLLGLHAFRWLSSLNNFIGLFNLIVEYQLANLLVFGVAQRFDKFLFKGVRITLFELKKQLARCFSNDFDWIAQFRANVLN
jgi:hypothetical protein